MTTTISVTAAQITVAPLHSVELFKGLTGNEILQLLATSEDLSFIEGETVFQAGDMALCLIEILFPERKTALQ